jgi:hypothetical protein
MRISRWTLDWRWLQSDLYNAGIIHHTHGNSGTLAISQNTRQLPKTHFPLSSHG